MPTDNMQKENMIQNILLDTNMLLAAAKGTPLFAQLEEEYPQSTACVLPQTIAELEKLAKQPKIGQFAKLGLALAKRQHLKIVSQSKTYADDALLAACQQLGAVLATQDAELQRRALDAGIRVLGIRKKKLLREVTQVKR